MKAHLLYPNRDFSLDETLPPHTRDLTQDLDLETLLSAMAGGDPFIADTVRKVMLTPLTDPGEVRYRQGVLADSLAEPDLVRGIYELASAALREKRGSWGFFSNKPESILAGGVRQLELLVNWLKKLRRIADETAGQEWSAGFTAFFTSLGQDLDDDYFALVQHHLAELRFPKGQFMSAGLARDNSGVDYVLRPSDEGHSRWKEHLGLAPRSAYSFSVPARDDAAAQAMEEITGRALNSVANAVAQSADHISSYFTMLRLELGFYVGCLNLHDHLLARHAPISFPDPVAWSPASFACSSLQDASLTLRLGHSVVGNDLEAHGMTLAVITGANSGGKSTFLRSVGLAQLMLQAGMFVVADSYRATLFERIFTHFIRDEDPTLTHGRFDDELARMSTIADALTDHSLVLFNESFAATNEREGSEIARQVVTALIEAGVRIFFVTHLFDFADRTWRQGTESTVFLRAEQRRDFKLVKAPPLPTSFGPDLYQRLGRWLGEDDSRAAEATSCKVTHGG